jgi:DNA-binding GntR family transcriptional regulator
MQVIGLKRPLREILQEHLDMVSEIHSRDAERAVLLMRNHLQNSKHVFLS